MLDVLLEWDERMFRLLNADWLNPALDRIMPFVTDGRNYTIPLFAAAIILAVVGRWRGVRFLVLAVISIIVADAIGSHVLKPAFFRIRPCNALEGVRPLVGCTNSPSFPSNHAVNASALATLVALYMPRLWLPATALAFIVGYSRVYVGAHYPLDVLAGGVLGVMVALVCAEVMNLVWPPSPEANERRRIFSLKMGNR
jgi:undecaprenyl-diphosphatase